MIKKNIVIIGPRAIGKSTVSKIVAEKNNLNYIEFDAYLDRYLIPYGGLIQALITGKAQKALNKDMPFHIKKILEEQGILLDLGGGAISSMYEETNKRNLETITNKSIVIPLIYSDDILESARVLYRREIQRTYPANNLRRIEEDYERFLKVMKQNAMNPIYCKNKSVEEICKEIDDRISHKI